MLSDLVNNNIKLLDEAYGFCEQITKEASSTFYLGSRMFPKESRKHVWAVYAFCRFSDDLVDKRKDDNELIRCRLGVLRSMISKASAGASHSDEMIGCDQEFVNAATHLFMATRDTFEKYPTMKIEPFLQLLSGVERDLDQVRFVTNHDLERYCDDVAGTVGIMICGLCGVDDPEVLEDAQRLGKAMQMTNILRDVGEDERAGRIYLPQETLSYYGIKLPLIDAYRDSRLSFGQMMKNMIADNRKEYAVALKSLRVFPVRVHVALLCAALIYEDILISIEKNGYDVFSYRAYVPWWRKFWCLLRSCTLLL